VHLSPVAPSTNFATADDAADFFIASFSAAQAHADATHAAASAPAVHRRAGRHTRGTGAPSRNATYFEEDMTAAIIPAKRSRQKNPPTAGVSEGFSGDSFRGNSSISTSNGSGEGLRGYLSSSSSNNNSGGGGGDFGSEGSRGGGRPESGEDEYVVHRVKPDSASLAALRQRARRRAQIRRDAALAAAAPEDGEEEEEEDDDDEQEGGGGGGGHHRRALLGYSTPPTGDSPGVWDPASPNSEFIKLDVWENDVSVALAPQLNFTMGTKVGTLQFVLTPLLDGDALVRPKYTFMRWTWDAAAGIMMVEAPSPGFNRYSLWLEALTSVGFMTTSDDTAPRAVSMSYERRGISTVLTNVNINVTLTNDRPSLTGIPVGVVYTVGAAPIDVGPVAAIRDDDDTHLRGMHVVISSNYEPFVDFLRIDPAKELDGSIAPTCTFHAHNGTMTMTGHLPKAKYTAALRALQYRSTTENPALPDRRLRFILWDGSMRRSNEDPEDRLLFTDMRIVSRDVAFVITSSSPICTEAGKAEEGRAQSMLLSKPTAPVLCSVSTSDSSEGIVQPNFVVLTESNWNTLDSAINVIGQSDDLDDGNVQFQIEIAVMVTQDQDYAKAMPGLATFTNIDDPLNLVRVNATVSADAATGLLCATSEEGDECPVVLTVSHWHSGYQEFSSIVVTITSLNPAEGKIVAPNGGGQLVLPSVDVAFTEDNWQTPRTVMIRGVDDGRVDPNTRYNITFAAVVHKVGIDGGLPVQPYNLAPSIQLINTDDDVPSIDVKWLNDEPCLETTEQGDYCSFSVQLGAQPLAPVTIDLLVTGVNGVGSSDEGTVTEPTNRRLVFDAASWSDPQWVSVQGLDDSEADGPQVFELHIGPASSSDPNYDAMLVDSFNFTNLDNDVKQLEVMHKGIRLQSMAMWVDETGRSDPFSVQLPADGKAPNSDVTVSVVTADPTEGLVSPAEVVFTPTTYMNPQTITITGVDDEEIDGAARFGVTLTTSSNDVFFDGVEWSFYVRNYDDDGLDLSPRECNTTEAGGSCEISMSLPSWRDAEYERVEVFVNSSNPAEAVTTQRDFVFVQSNWSDLAKFSIVGQDDFVDDGPQLLHFDVRSKLYFKHHAGGNGLGWKWTKPFRVEARNFDDDTASVIVMQAGGVTNEAGTQRASFSVAVTSEPVGTLTVPISSVRPLEGLPSVNMLTFTASNWRTPVTVDVEGQDDYIDDDDQLYDIRIGPAVTEEAAYAGFERNLNFTNLDDITLA
jgi:hypothetical protein